MFRNLFCISLCLLFFTATANELEDLNFSIGRIEVLFAGITPQYLKLEESYAHAKKNGIKASAYANEDMEAIVFSIQRIDSETERLAETSKKVQLSKQQEALMQQWMDVFGQLMDGIQFEYDTSQYPTTADYLYAHPYDWEKADERIAKLKTIRLKLFPE